MRGVMGYRAIFIIAALVAKFLCAPAMAAPVDLSVDQSEAIGTHLQFLKEGASPFSLNEALDAYAAGEGQASDVAILNFGIGSKPVWFKFEAMNPTAAGLTRRITVETAWLDKIDVYFVRDGREVKRYHTGDLLPFASRPVRDRFFSFDFVFKPGTTSVMMRVETTDPIVVPIYVKTVDESLHGNMYEAYSYGFIYGAILALLAYNFILFLSLNNTRYVFYSIYLISFLAMNLGYTGHGYEWLWSESPRLQMWLILVFMVTYAISGLVFATQFLETKENFPRIHRVIISSIVGMFSLSALAMAAGSHEKMVWIAFAVAFIFPLSMVLLGGASILAGIKFAKYFVFASLAAMTGAFSTAMVVSGTMPYSILAYRAIEIGMLIDAVLLALALADQFRVTQEAKTRAEEMAKIDPLTGINNRRAFTELVAPAWSTGLRHNHNMAVIILDLDRFKTINDTYGHALGDEVLVKVAATITKAARRGDVAARWGGEEFIMFLPETNLHDAVFVAERMRENIASMRLEGDGVAILLTASFGVAERGSRSLLLDGLIRAADEQLYAAKQHGRNKVCSSLSA